MAQNHIEKMHLFCEISSQDLSFWNLESCTCVCRLTLQSLSISIFYSSYFSTIISPTQHGCRKERINVERLIIENSGSARGKITTLCHPIWVLHSAVLFA